MAFAQVSIELRAIYFHSFEIFNIQIGEGRFVKQILLLSSQIIFRMLKKANVQNLRSRFCCVFEMSFLKTYSAHSRK
jgi:hypothetical protein